jgi:methyl-accepting chemotaxis protein
VQELLAGVRRVNGTLGSISASTREQSAGLGHINESVATLDRMNQQNVEQSAAAAQSLKAQAAALVAAVSQFRLDAVPAEAAELAATGAALPAQ